MMVSLSPQIIAVPAMAQTAGRPTACEEESGFALPPEADDGAVESELDTAPMPWGALVLPPMLSRAPPDNPGGDVGTPLPQMDDVFRSRMPPQFLESFDFGATPLEPRSVTALPQPTEPGHDMPSRRAADAPRVLEGGDPVALSLDHATAAVPEKTTGQSTGPKPGGALFEPEPSTGHFTVPTGAGLGKLKPSDLALTEEDRAPPAVSPIGSKETAARLRAGADIVSNALIVAPTELEAAPHAGVPVETSAAPALEHVQKTTPDSDAKASVRFPAPHRLVTADPKELSDPPQTPVAHLTGLPVTAEIIQVEMLRHTSVQTSALPHLQPPLTSAAFPPDLPLTLIVHAKKAAESPIELLLNPEELGRLRFEMVQNGDQIKVVLSVEQPETLDLLRKHVDQLLAEFKQAGFPNASLSFGQWGQGSPGPWKSPAAQDRLDGAIDIVEDPQKSTRLLHRAAGQSSSTGLDLRL